MTVALACFALGFIARICRSDLSFPAAARDTLAILLLLAIGLKGGVQLAELGGTAIVLPAFGIVAMAGVITVLAFIAARRFVRLARIDAAAVAAHYGSVSIATFAVAGEAFASRHVDVPAAFGVYVVLLEVPAIFIGIALARSESTVTRASLADTMRDIFAGKSIMLLVGGLVIGALAGRAGLGGAAPLVGDGFSILLVVFLLDMGTVCAERVGSLRACGVRLLCCAIAMPLVGAAIGALTGRLLGFDVGGIAMLATLAASASYIAAPAAMRAAVPEANVSLAITASIGVTFPFNVVVGIPLYLELARLVGG